MATTKKSMDARQPMWFFRNVFQVGEGGLFLRSK